MAELSEEERSRLRLEEIFRDEVRRSLQPRGRRAALSRFFNSPLGIFVLSSLVLGGLSFSYAQFQVWHTRHEQSTERARRLDVEIAFRVRQIEPLRRPEIGYGEFQLAASSLHGEASYDDDGQRMDLHYSVFPEFRDSSLAALLWELRSIGGSARQKSIDLAANAVQELFPLLDLDEHFTRTKKRTEHDDSRWAMNAPERERLAAMLKCLERPEWFAGATEPAR